MYPSRPTPSRLKAAALAAIGTLSTLGSVAPAAIAATPGHVDSTAFYGRGFDFWSKVNRISQGSNSTTDLLGLLDSSFDRPEEGIAGLNLRYQARSDQWLSGIIDQAYFGLGADALAGGVAHNRILPHIKAYESFSGHLDFGVVKPLPAAREAGWEYGLGSTIGAGRQTLIDESAISMLSDFAPNSATLFYTGLDAHVGFRSRMSPLLESEYRLELHPTIYHSDFSDSPSQYKLESDRTTLRWRQKNEWTLTLDSDYDPTFDIGLHTLLGQQPIPITFLPRTWDGVHDLSAWPSFGQLVGLGSKFRVYHSESGIGASVFGGFYGGYLGASAVVNIYHFEASVGTYGLEQSSGFRLSESRLEFIAIGGRLAL
jgi:hypothetical protein